MREPVNEFEEARLNLLAHLISDILDIKIVLIENSRMIGIYHEKMGIIADDFGNAVAFSGSNNESAAAMLANYETIDVYCSWKGDADRVKAKADAFSSLWSDQEPHLRVVEFPELKDEIIGRYRRAEPRYDIDSLEFGVSCTAEGAYPNDLVASPFHRMYRRTNTSLMQLPSGNDRAIAESLTWPRAPEKHTHV